MELKCKRFCSEQNSRNKTELESRSGELFQRKEEKHRFVYENYKISPVATCRTGPALQTHPTPSNPKGEVVQTPVILENGVKKQLFRKFNLRY